MPSKSAMSTQMRVLLLTFALLGLVCFLSVAGLVAYFAPAIKTAIAAQTVEPRPEETIYYRETPEELLPVEPEVSEARSNALALTAVDFNGDVQPTEFQIAEYTALWSRVKGYWGTRNTDGQIHQALQTIYRAKQFFPEVTMHYAITTLSEQIPAGVSLVDEGEAEAVSVKKRDSESGWSRESAASKVTARQSRTLREEGESILIVAQKTYAYLEETYYAPMVAAQEAEQARLDAIAENQANARAEGIAKNRAKYEAAQGANAQQQAWREQGARWSAEQKQKQRARGWIK